MNDLNIDMLLREFRREFLNCNYDGNHNHDNLVVVLTDVELSGRGYYYFIAEMGKFCSKYFESMPSFEIQRSAKHVGYIVSFRLFNNEKTLKFIELQNEEILFTEIQKINLEMKGNGKGVFSFQNNNEKEL